MKYLAILTLGLFLAGCTTTTPPNAIGPAALTAAVSLGVSFGLEQHPEATPYVRVAATTVCGVASGTNIAPAQIVSALASAGVTNATARLIVNGALATYNIAFTYYGTNLATFKPYAQALCDGLTQALPPSNAMAPKTKAVVLPPHLK